MSLNTGVLRLPNQAVSGTSDTGFSDIGFDVSGNPATANAAGTVKYLPQSASAAAAAEVAKLGVRGADIASAATLNLEAATGELVDVTGTTGITAITLSEGHRRIVRFTGILTLTHGASLVLLGAANITTAAGDMAVFVGYAAGVVRMAAFAKAANGIVMTGTGSLTMADSITIAAGGWITTASGGYIRTSASGFIDTAAGGSIATGTGALTGPNESGTIALVTKKRTFITASDILRYNTGGFCDFQAQGTTFQGASMPDAADTAFQILLDPAEWGGRAAKVTVVFVGNVSSTANVNFDVGLDWKTTAIDGATNSMAGPGYGAGGGAPVQNLNQAGPATQPYPQQFTSQQWNITAGATFLSLWLRRYGNTDAYAGNISVLWISIDEQ